MGNAVTCSLVDVVGLVSVTQTDGQILEFVQPISAAQVKKLHPGNWLVHYVSVHDTALGKQHGKMSVLQGNEELEAGQIYFLLPIPSHFRKQLFARTHNSKQRSSSSKTDIIVAAPVPPLLLLPPPPSESQQQSFMLSDGPWKRSLLPAPPPAPKSQQQPFILDRPRSLLPAPPPASKSQQQMQPFALDGPRSLLPAPPPVPKSQQQHLSLDSNIGRSSRPFPVFSMPSSPLPQQQHVQPSRPHKRCRSRHKTHVCDWRPTLVTIQEVF